MLVCSAEMAQRFAVSDKVMALGRIVHLLLNYARVVYDTRGNVFGELAYSGTFGDVIGVISSNPKM